VRLTPKAFAHLLQLRIDRARELLETTDLPVAVVAHRSGLGSVDSLRDHFVRTTGLTPSAYRATFTHSPTATTTRARRGH
jgi:transcriptional regulator GlxA family with amidase domain